MESVCKLCAEFVKEKENEATLISMGESRGNVVVCRTNKEIVHEWPGEVFWLNPNRQTPENQEKKFREFSLLYDNIPGHQRSTESIAHFGSSIVKTAIAEGTKTVAIWLPFCHNIWGIPSAEVTPVLIESIDLALGDAPLEVWIFMFTNDSYNETKSVIRKYLHERSHPIHLHASACMSLNKIFNETRIDHPVTNGRCFSVPSFFSKAECENLIKLTEKLQFKSIAWEYAPSYRNCSRLIGFDENLSNLMWDRISQVLTRDDIENIRPYGFGAEGVWCPDHINSCIRFSKYKVGNHFQAHRDGGFVINDDLRSVYTIMVYLNEEFNGGETEIYECEPKSSNSKLCHTIKPTTGTAIIFNHDLMHKGCKVADPPIMCKYILRTDIMFKRIDRRELIHYQNFPEYIEAERLYQESIKLQKKGDPKGSTKSYLEAMEMQAQLASVVNRTESMEAMNHLPVLPMEVWSIIGSYLEVKDLCNLCLVSGYFKYVAEDGCLWKDKFAHRYSTFLPASDSPTRFTNWKLCYRDQIETQKYFNIVFCYIQDTFTYYGSHTLTLAQTPINCRNSEWNDSYESRKSNSEKYVKMPSVVSRVLGHYWSAGMGNHDYYVGYEAQKERNYEYAGELKPYARMNSDTRLQYNREILPSVLMWIYNCAFSVYINPRCHPGLLIVPFNAKGQIQKLVEIYFDKINVPYLCVQSDAVVALYSTSIRSAIVLCFTSPESVCIVPVNDRKVVPGHSVVISHEKFDESLSNMLCKVVSGVRSLLTNTTGEIEVVSVGEFVPANFVQNFCSRISKDSSLRELKIRDESLSIVDGCLAFIQHPNIRQFFYTKAHCDSDFPWTNIY